MKLTKIALAIVAAAGLGASAYAVPINGTIDLAGTAQFNGPIASATQVSSFSNAHVEFAEGDFATFTNTNDPVAITAPYIFNPSTAYSPLYSVGGFVFSLTSSTIVMQDVHGLVITGNGFFTGNGFDMTAGTWAFSSQNAGGSATRTKFSFSTDSVAQGNVPEGGSALALLGIGLVAVEALRRKLATA